MAVNAIGIDIGGTKVLGGVVTGTGEILATAGAIHRAKAVAR